MTAAQLDYLKANRLLDLGAYLDSMREPMAQIAGMRDVITRVHQLECMGGRQVIWLYTEGLN